jgi:hypothetical protein
MHNDGTPCFRDRSPLLKESTMTKTLKDIATDMAGIDIAILSTHTD